MSYTPPSGDNVDFSFQGGYTPPAGNELNFFNETAGRSKLRQETQIRNSVTYDDNVSGVNTLEVAEPTISGSLENDVNVIRTLIKQAKGTSSWYDAPESDITTLYNALYSGVGDKYIESVSGTITKNTEHILPYDITYTPDSTAGAEGSNMDVFINGMLLAADTGTNGVNADRDYGETSASGITFRFDIQTDFNIVYVVRE
jgi:hypothetical protein